MRAAELPRTSRYLITETLCHGTVRTDPSHRQAHLGLRHNEVTRVDVVVFINLDHRHSRILSCRREESFSSKGGLQDDGGN
jgi:hypothetical protein